jgi:hypothetical protein
MNIISPCLHTRRLHPVHRANGVLTHCGDAENNGLPFYSSVGSDIFF